MLEIALLLLVFAGTTLTCAWVLGSLDEHHDRVRRRLEEIARARGGGRLQTESLPDEGADGIRPSLARAWREAAVAAVDRLVTGRSVAGRTARELRRAGLRWRASEWLMVRWAIAFGGLMLGFALGGAPLALAGVAAGGWVTQAYLRRRAGLRRKACDAQLPDALSLMSNALRSGYSFLQAVEVASRELPEPLGGEFAQVIRETRLGIAPDDALNNLTERVRSDDLDLVVTAVLIQRHVGGNLAEVFEKIAGTIRERVRILGEIRTLTAQGRISGWIVASLPVALGLLLYALNPAYMQPLVGQPAGWALLGAAAVMQLIGLLVIRSIVNLEV